MADCGVCFEHIMGRGGGSNVDAVRGHRWRLSPSTSIKFRGAIFATGLVSSRFTLTKTAMQRQVSAVAELLSSAQRLSQETDQREATHSSSEPQSPVLTILLP